MDNFYNKHYIRIDADNNIICGWSDGVYPDRDTIDAICINEQGGYQFRLFLFGEENPSLINEQGVYLYRYIDDGVVAKTPEEIQTEISAPKPAPPTLEEQVKALSAAVIEMAGEIYG